uniref:Uncharacterized protein n=1 Tax=Utricularia reniformis TaxID=192314 RepID=A0A1Y0B248_9LAMI|nr:hypothetical protein AEK19_MT1256 [Utricularia reniformis]ART31464.1 hypothetical protein AEK19_MT1256 [Utricularia reniformis]
MILFSEPLGRYLPTELLLGVKTALSNFIQLIEICQSFQTSATHL